jgi:hypothetical protein
MPVTVMWGERGLVATWFLDLAADQTLGRWQAFLDAIAFGGAGPGLDWQQVQTPWTVVEPDFGNRGFGHPDAVARLLLPDQRKIVLLLEAKLVSYVEACWPPILRGQPGYNSKLNGQVELNHCLALALAAYQPGNPSLIEPAWVLQTPYAAARPHGRRYLLDPTVRQQVADPLSLAQHYLQVIVTTNDANPFADQALQPLWPQLFVAAGDGNVWDQLQPTFGWVSWQRLHDLARDAAGPNSLFLPSWNLNFPDLPQEPDVGGGEEPPPPAPAGIPPDWPPNRPLHGVSLIYAPALNPKTFLHFSWRRNRCCLRDYLRDPAPWEDRTWSTSAVLPLILKEEWCGPRRPPVGDDEAWRTQIQALNQRHGLNYARGEAGGG